MPGADDRHVELTRRAFLASCSSLAVAFAGCARLGPAARAGYALLNDPPLPAYGEVLDGLIAAVVPLEDSSFPVAVERLRARLLDLFRLDRDPRFVTVERTLVLFDDVELYAHSAPLRGGEREILVALDATLDPETLLDQRAAEDRARFASFTAGAASRRPAFRALDLDRKREYLRLWARSAFILRRRFYASARSLILIAAYSMPDVWAAIGYDGPLVPTRNARHGHAPRM